MKDYLAAFPHDDYQVYEVPDLGKFYIDDNVAEVKETLRRGRPWEKHLIREFKKTVVPGSIVIEVGAHIGSLTLPLAELAGSKGQVYAFEPQRKIFRELIFNLRLNEINNVVPLRLAVSSEAGFIEMNPVRVRDGRVGVGQGGDEVESRTLDSFGFANVSVIKIDVEGHENQVLQGAKKTLAENRPVIYVEIRRDNLEAAQPMLEELGYSLQRLKGHDYKATFTG